MAPNRDVSARGTTPQERGTTRGTASPHVDPDRGVDLGGQWDDQGNTYWYSDDGGRTWLFDRQKQTWEVLARPEDAIHVSGRAPIPTPSSAAPPSKADLFQKARNDDYRRFLGSVGTAHRRRFRTLGAPTVMLGEVTGKVLDKIDPLKDLLPAELEIGITPGLAMLRDAAGQIPRVIADMAAEYQEAEMKAIAQRAHEDGDLYHMPVSVGTMDKLEHEQIPPSFAVAGTVQAKAARSPARVDRFMKALAIEYQKAIITEKRLNPSATPSMIGIEAEKRTLSRIDALARVNGLNPNHIMAGSIPTGVTGPGGGATSVEAASAHYGFMIELKKSPKAVRWDQAQAHQLATSKSVNFPKGGMYVRIFGEKFKGSGIERSRMGTDLDAKEKRRLKSGRR